MKNILVTGGAGYIGSVLIGLLLEKNYKVRTIDNLSFGDQGIAGYHEHPHFEFHLGDLRHEQDLAKALENIDAVIHLAAIVGDPACAKYPELAVAINKTASENLFDLALKHNVKRFVFISTCSNYGKMADPDGFVDETSELSPISLYAELKVGFEKYIFENSDDSITPVVLRFATAFGLSCRPRFDLTVNEFTRQLALSRRLEIYGEQFWRPYCHTSDLAAACLAAVETDSSVVDKQAFNVGDNNENYRKKDLIKLILKQLPDRENYVSYIKKIEDPRDYRVCFDKISHLLNYKTKVSVSDGIKEIIDAISDGTIVDPDDKKYVNL